MYHIEVLPAVTSAATPGWAYVPDTGFDPSKQAIVPSGARGRARTSHYGAASGTAATGAEQLSAREQAKVVKHLAALDRENHKDVQIVVPGRPKDVAQKALHGKMTPGVKKILQSQKTWRNYLDDEEAAIALQKPVPAGLPRQASSLDTSTPIETPDTPLPARTAATLDANIAALIDIEVPSVPSKAELEMLLSAPPLSYNAARAAPSTSSAPPRQFCDMCGYWGRARCMKCGVRICGLECKRAHEETRCLKFYA